MGGMGRSTDDQIKKERQWWSEHALVEVRELELSVKRDLQKIAADLREQFRRQLEIERNDSQLRDSSLQRMLARLRDDVDAMRETQQPELGQPRAAPAREDLQELVEKVAAKATQVEANMRLELDAVTYRVQDCQRQQQEELSVALAAQQAALEAERAKMQQNTALLQEGLSTLSIKLNNSDRPRNDGSLLNDRLEAKLSAALSEERSARSRELDSVRNEVRCLAKDLIEESLAQTQRVQGVATASKASVEMDAKVQDVMEVIKAECTQRRAEVDSLRAELSKEQDARKVELNEVQGAWHSEVQRLAEDIANSRVAGEAASSSSKQITDLGARVSTQIKDLEERVQVQLTELSQRSNCGTVETVSELARYLDAECTTRRTEVEDLRHQLAVTETLIMERTTTEFLQNSINELDMRLGSLVGALDTEREARRSDDERHQQSHCDLREELNAERRLRLAEVEKLRAAVAELALNVKTVVAGEAPIENSQELSRAFASLRAVLDEEAGGAHRSEFGEAARSRAADAAGARRSDQSAALVREAAELLARIRSLGAELRSELSSQVGSLRTELRGELGSRVDAATASLRGEVAAARAELRGDVEAGCGEVHGDLSRQLEGLAAEVRGQGAAMGSQNGRTQNVGSAAVIGQLSEVLRLMQIITASSEVLAEKICGEATARRATEGRLEQRVTAAERRLANLGAAEEPLPPMEVEPPMLPVPSGASTTGAAGEQQQQQQLQQQLQAQSMISEDLKDSLEKLVSRVNKMLKPEDAGALQREGSFTPAVRAISRSHSPESQRSGLFPLLGPDGGGLAGASGPSSAAATPSNPEALARHPGNSGSLRVSAVPPGAGALGPRLVPRRGELAAAGAAAPPQAPRSSDQAKLIHKAVQELYHENSQLRDEIGSPQRGRVRPEGLGQAIAAGPGSRVGSGVAGGAGGSTTGSMAASAGGGVQKGSPRTSSLAQAAPAQQGLARGMQVARGPAQGAAVLPGQGRGAPQQQQAVRRNVMSHSYGRTGSASGIAPSR